MKKKVGIIILSFIGLIILLGIVFFTIDYNRVKKQELPLFCIKTKVYKDGGTTEYLGLGYKVIDYHIMRVSIENNKVSIDSKMYIGTLAMDYNDNINDKTEPDKLNNGVGISEIRYIGSDLKDLPQNYSAQQAAKDGCFVITNENTIYNKDKLDKFILNTGINAKNRKEDKIRIVYFTVEGCPIITDLEYKILDETYILSGENVNKTTYIMSIDNTRDRFATQADRKISVNNDIPGNIYGITTSSDGNDNIKIDLAVYAEINYASPDSKIYENITICTFAENVVIKQAYPYFFGKVIESNINSIVVKPNDNESISKSTDKVLIDLGENNDAIYKVGTNVKIIYTGLFTKTYPAKIEAVNIEIKTADEFEIIFENDIESSKLITILDKTETNKYNYNIYAIGSNVNIFINGETLSLREALLNNKITMDEIIENANEDYKNDRIQAYMYKDGGSMVYNYSNYTIIKYNKLDGNKDVYIGRWK